MHRSNRCEIPERDYRRVYDIGKSYLSDHSYRAVNILADNYAANEVKIKYL